jgi:hypothetical protein
LNSGAGDVSSNQGGNNSESTKPSPSLTSKLFGAGARMALEGLGEATGRQAHTARAMGSALENMFKNASVKSQMKVADTAPNLDTGRTTTKTQSSKG